METNARVLTNARPGTAARSRLARIVLGLAGDQDRERIYEVRHAIYACELGQHAVNQAGRLSDSLDPCNHFLVAKVDQEIAGFISITPPGAPSFSIDKYLDRRSLPFHFGKDLYEIRLLTVLREHRGREF